MSSSASKNAPNPKKRKLASSRRSNSSRGSNRAIKRQKDVRPAAKLGPPVSPPTQFKFSKAPSLAPVIIERIVARKKMAGEDRAKSETLKEMKLLDKKDKKGLQSLINDMGLLDPKLAIKKTEQDRKLKEQKRQSQLVYDFPSGLSKKDKSAHMRAVREDQEQRAKLQKPAREKGETEKERQERERLERERQERESARLSAQMAELKAKKDAAAKNDKSFEFRGPVYTNRVLAQAQAKEKTEGRKKKGSKKGKKGRLGHRKNKTKRN